MEAKPKVLLDPNFRRMEEIFNPGDLARLNSAAEVIWAKNERMPDAVLNPLKAGLFAVVSPGWRYGSLSDFPGLRAILDVGGGFPSPSALNYPECFTRGIRVLTCAPAFGPMVAEMALGMALSCTRQIVEGHRAFLVGEESYLWSGNVGSFTLYGQTVGFIGFGGLAHALKPLLDPFHCQILAYDPWLPEHAMRRQGVLPTSLEDLVSRSRVIFVLAVPSKENKGLLNRDLLNKIQPDSVLALMSRAHLVDFDALTELVSQGKFKAVIDVYPQEPLPKDHPIRKAPGVIFSAHRAGSVEQDLREIGRMAVDDLIAMIAGLPPTEMQAAQPEFVYKLP